METTPLVEVWNVKEEPVEVKQELDSEPEEDPLALSPAIKQEIIDIEENSVEEGHTNICSALNVIEAGNFLEPNGVDELLCAEEIVSEEVIASEKAEEHISVVLLKQNECNICKKILSSPSHLEKHLKYHIHGKRKLCKVCKKIFANEDVLLEHQKKHRRRRREEHKCDLCSKLFVNKRALDMHMKYHSEDFKCQLCGKVLINKAGLRRHTKLHLRLYPCEICDMSFGTTRQLRNHIAAHTEIPKTKLLPYMDAARPYTCHVCRQSYEFSTSLAYHMKLHAADNPFQCKECGKCVASARTYRVHVERHLREKGIEQCRICGEGFSSRFQLLQHFQEHKTVKHKCDDCGREIASFHKFSLHIKLHVQGKGIKCKECGQVFASQKEVKRHVQRHPRNGFQCRECHMELTAAEFTSHLRTHSGYKPFQCRECDESFKFSTDLITHFKLHSTLNPVSQN